MKRILPFFLSACLALFSLSCKKDTKKTESEPEPEVPMPRKVYLDTPATNLRIPWGLAVLPNGDLLFGEREGNLNIFKKGSSGYKTLMHRVVNMYSEGGLLGIAVDPDFTNNHFVYVYETIGSLRNHVVKFKLEGETFTEIKVIVDNIPFNNNHNGGCLKFGPDGFLYIGTGDVQTPSQAQDLTSLAGKILRTDRDGNVPPGNPFNTLVWSYGHRNVQGFCWTGSGKMFATEHGPSGEFGWCCHDEVNLIQPGGNYGWPLSYGGLEKDSLIPSVANSGDDTWAPSGCTWLGSSSLWPNSIVVASLKGERLIRFYLNAQENGFVSSSDTLKNQFHRLRNVIEMPDGTLYFCTSNIPNGNAALPGDDKLFRISRK